MAQSVKLADDVMALVREESSLQSRSVAGQVAHWVKIGHAVEHSGHFDYARIRAALKASLSPDALSPEEQDTWFASFADNMAEPGESEQGFYAQRRQLGRGVGLSDAGEIIRQKPQK